MSAMVSSGLEAFRPYADTDLRRRVRVLSAGLAYWDRSREAVWDGHAEVTDNTFFVRLARKAGHFAWSSLIFIVE